MWHQARFRAGLEIGPTTARPVTKNFTAAGPDHQQRARQAGAGAVRVTGREYDVTDGVLHLQQ